jgi:aspartate ammonia-lyase
LILPALQAGSSIMPGKVNPVMLEAVEQVCLSSMNADALVATAASESNLELPQFLPLIAHAILSHNERLAGALSALAVHVAGIQADEKNIRRNLERSASLATLLSPLIGYESASLLVKESIERDCSIADLAVEKGLISREHLEKLMRPEMMASPGIIDLPEDTHGA